MSVIHPDLPSLLDDLAGGRPWHREPLDKHVDSLSGSPFERAVVEGGQSYVVKHIARDLDWIMRVLGDGAGGAPPWALTMWAEGLLDRLPAEIDHVIVGMAYERATGRLSQVMRDASVAMVPATADRVPLAQHRGFLDHLAAMHATFWGFRDTYGLITPLQRYGFAHPDQTAREAAAGHEDVIPGLFPSGWQHVAELAPEAAAVALGLARDPAPLAAAMADGPRTLVHGDWKFGNLGTWPDGRTVLLDWAWPGEAGPAVDLAWYLAVNCDRLPESKEDCIDAYRSALSGRNVATAGWWDEQLELALVGAFVQLGWSKPGNPAELGWWTERTAPTLRRFTSL